MACKACSIYPLPLTGVFYCSSLSSVLKFPFGARVVPWASACFAGMGKGGYGWGGYPIPRKPGHLLSGGLYVLSLIIP